jgi:predicted histone-like DNA-binding protein
MANFEFPYVCVQRNQTVGLEPGTKYRRQQLNTGKLSFDGLVQKIVEREGLTRADVYAAVSALEDVIKEELCEGRSVNMKFLGTFTPYLQAENKNTLALAKTQGGGKIHIRFLPSPDFRKFIKDEVTLKEFNLQISGLQP